MNRHFFCGGRWLALLATVMMVVCALPSPRLLGQVTAPPQAETLTVDAQAPP